MVKGLYLGAYKLANRYLNTLGSGHLWWKPQKSSHGAQLGGRIHPEFYDLEKKISNLVKRFAPRPLYSIFTRKLLDGRPPPEMDLGGSFSSEEIDQISPNVQGNENIVSVFIDEAPSNPNSMKFIVRIHLTRIFPSLIKFTFPNQTHRFTFVRERKTHEFWHFKLVKFTNTRIFPWSVGKILTPSCKS